MTATKRKITVLPGDGIGPEVVDSALAIVKATGAAVEFEICEAGARAFQKGRATSCSCARSPRGRRCGAPGCGRAGRGRRPRWPPGRWRRRGPLDRLGALPVVAAAADGRGRPAPARARRGSRCPPERRTGRSRTACRRRSTRGRGTAGLAAEDVAEVLAQSAVKKSEWCASCGSRPSTPSIAQHRAGPGGTAPPHLLAGASAAAAGSSAVSRWCRSAAPTTTSARRCAVAVRRCRARRPSRRGAPAAGVAGEDPGDRGAGVQPRAVPLAPGAAITLDELE